ncbi:MAG: ABC transporter ATP-binding protein [Pseudomonadota bacterium]
MALLEINDLQFTWPGHADPVLIIDSLQIQAGEKLFLRGPSGSGKSSLLALIGGLIQPQSGVLTCLNEALTSLRGPKRDRFRADHLGVVFQQFNLLPWLDVRANVMLPCRFARRRAQRAGNINSAAEALLQAMDLEPDLWSRRADELSVGQQQRVAAARALIGQPELVLADEPTSALDSDRRDSFLELLFAQCEQAGSALLFVSHDQELAGRFDRQLDLASINRAGVRA